MHGILQARILEWVAMPASRGLSHPGIDPTSVVFHALARGFFTTSTTWDVLLVVAMFYNGEGNGTPLQYFCLENPMDGGAW